MRAIMCLAEVHALLGHGQIALAYVQEMRGYFLGRETDDWELAFTHAIYAHAAAVAGKADEHRAAYQAAATALAAIADEEDRVIVARTFAQVPPPRLRASAEAARSSPTVRRWRWRQRWKDWPARRRPARTGRRSCG